MAPLVSVVMSVYNGDKFLPEAVESILGQSFDDLELIVIDDGSTDRSYSILESYCKRDLRVQVCRQENRGLISSLNWACAMAKGKYIARMDADDIAIRDRLKWQVSAMERNDALGVVGGAVEWINSQGKPLGRCHNPVGDFDIRSVLPKFCVFWHPTVMIRREVLELVGGYRRVCGGRRGLRSVVEGGRAVSVSKLGSSCASVQDSPATNNARKT